MQELNKSEVCDVCGGLSAFDVFNALPVEMKLAVAVAALPIAIGYWANRVDC